MSLNGVICARCKDSTATHVIVLVLLHSVSLAVEIEIDMQMPDVWAAAVFEGRCSHAISQVPRMSVHVCSRLTVSVDM